MKTKAESSLPNLLLPGLLLQLAIILLCIYLERDVAFRAGEARAPRRPHLGMRPLSTQ